MSQLAVNSVTDANGGNTATILQRRFNEAFEYRDGKLFWKINPNPLKDFVGKEAGNDGKKGYRWVQIFGKKRATHRVIWEMFNGAIPEGMQIDHINNNRLDNRLENLRLATNSQNGMNKGKRKDSNGPYKNVFWNKASKKWQVKVQGKYIGRFDDPEFAELVAIEARAKYHGEFARSI